MRSIFLAVLFGASAFAQKINAEFDSTIDFSKYQTFLIRGGHPHDILTACAHRAFEHFRGGNLRCTSFTQGPWRP